MGVRNPKVVRITVQFAKRYSIAIVHCIVDHYIISYPEQALMSPVKQQEITLSGNAINHYVCNTYGIFMYVS